MAELKYNQTEKCRRFYYFLKASGPGIHEYKGSVRGCDPKVKNLDVFVTEERCTPFGCDSMNRVEIKEGNTNYNLKETCDWSSPYNDY